MSVPMELYWTPMPPLGQTETLDKVAETAVTVEPVVSGESSVSMAETVG
jgi:hypothetical protein